MLYYCSAIVHNLVSMLFHVFVSPANTLLCFFPLCFAGLNAFLEDSCSDGRCLEEENKDSTPSDGIGIYLDTGGFEVVGKF